jgi:HEAT repeats
VTRGRQTGPWVQWCRVILACVLCVHAQRVRADDPRNTYLIKLLQGSSQFRVRAQAAISLGAVESSSGAITALTAALSDAHPAVRAAAANSLGRIGNASSVAALRKLQRDPEEPVRSAAQAAIAKLETSQPNSSVFASARSNPEPEPGPGPQLYYVAVAPPASRVPAIDRKALAEARNFIKQRVGQIRGVVLAPDGEDVHTADRVLKKNNLKGFALDSAIVSVEQKGSAGTRVAVSVIVATYPGRDMRAIMQGAATVSGGGAEASTQALQGALSGALRQLPQALAR